jgi:hypothetical protein
LTVGAGVETCPNLVPVLIQYSDFIFFTSETHHISGHILLMLFGVFRRNIRFALLPVNQVGIEL